MQGNDLNEPLPSTPDVRQLVLLAVGFGCMLGFNRMCSLGFLSYQYVYATSSLDPWFGLRTAVQVALLAVLALAGWRQWFKVGIKATAAACAGAIASAMLYAVDPSGTTGPAVAVLGGASMAVLMFVWMLLLCRCPVRVIVGATLSGAALSILIVVASPQLGHEVGLVAAVASAFVAGAAAVLIDPDLQSCAPDGPLEAAARVRIPWLTVAVFVLCAMFTSVLYAIAEYLTWLYDWQPNLAAAALCALAAIAATAAIMLRSRTWMHTVWVPLFALFFLAIVFSCFSVRESMQVAMGLMIAAVFSSQILVWVVFPSIFSVLKVPRVFLASVLLICVNVPLATLVGDVIGSVLPRSMQNLGSVSGLMAIAVAAVFALVFVASRNRQAGVVFAEDDEPETAAAEEAPLAQASAGEAGGASQAPAPVAETLAGQPDAEKVAPDNPEAPVDALKLRLDEFVEQFGLTPRESEVALYTVQGFSCAYIADKLVVSNSTVRFHQQNIYRKFDVHSRNELIELVTE